jgi:LacI family transcriptional regulator
MFFGYRKNQSLQTFAAKIPQTFSVKNFLALVIKKSGMENGATLKNISRVLNLSISTVSRALKNHPDISEQTKRKVQETALMLDYEPNTFAINLRKNKRNLIGVIIPSLSNFFYQSFISALEEEAKKNDYSLLILQSADDPENELENLRICRANRVAVIFVSISPATVNIGSFLKLSQSGTPVIFFDKVPEYEACDKVCCDDAGAAEIAAGEILKRPKCRVLGLFGNPILSITKKRMTVFQKAFKTKNRLSSLEIAYTASPDEAYRQVIRSFSKKIKPAIAFCMSDEILSGAIKAIQKLKLKIPGDVKIITISNDGFIPKLFEPEITYVETSGFELGKLCFRRMKDYMNGKTFIQEVLLPAKLVRGNSI